MEFDMDNPFFSNRRRYQQPDPIRRPFSPSPSFRSVPVYQSNPTRQTTRPAPPVNRPSERNEAPKVVRIPVQFVGSKQPDRSGSALKIQKVFRGFSVRKYLKKINDIKVQVDEIEAKLSNIETVELVRRNEKERLRLNESLMSLLIKLDSISGLDFGVRVCRKAVIRKAISLQERLDSINAFDLEVCNGETVADQDTEIGVSVDSPENSENLGVAICEEGGDNNHNSNMEIDEKDEVIDVRVDSEVKVSDVNCVDENMDLVRVECEKEKIKDVNNGEDENSKSNREMMEHMMKDNEKMMGLMVQLLERNESQTKMLNALTHRVELLEKAFLCDMLRKKKKKANKGGDFACRED